MNYLAYSILALVLLCLASGSCGQAIVEDNSQDNEVPANPPTTVQDSPAPPTTTKKPATPPKSGKVKVDTLKGSVACPTNCTCKEKPKRLVCVGLTNFPDWQGFDLTAPFSLDMEGSTMESVDLSRLQTVKDIIESLDLSRCAIRNFTAPPSSKKEKEPLVATFAKLKTLLLNENALQSIGKLSSWKFPSLETLDLSANPLVELGPSDLNNTKSLQTLNLKKLQLKSIHEQSFQSLSQLKTLNMTGTKLENHLGDKQFAGNQKLETVDLTDNGLIEVPFSLRSTGSITRLVLSSNNMTSLRQSDFINRTKLIELEIRGCPKLSKIDDLTFSDLTSLKRLIIADNPALNSISKDAFKSASTNHTLDIIDIRNNNLTTLASPLEFASLAFKQLLLSGNPWHCDCNLGWFFQLSPSARPLAHCKTPAEYKDIEMGEFLSTADCEIVDSLLRTVIVTGFFLFLFILVVLVFVQKSDICRRFLWRDQYGTIYYTKASFPPDTV